MNDWWQWICVVALALLPVPALVWWVAWLDHRAKGRPPVPPIVRLPPYAGRPLKRRREG